MKSRDVERCFVTCELLLQRQKRGGVLDRIMTGDEKWIHYDNVKRRTLWGKPGHASTTSAKLNNHSSKHLLCIWWNQKGVIYYELLKTNVTFTGDRLQLMRLSRSLKEKRPLYAQRHEKVIVVLCINNLPQFVVMTEFHSLSTKHVLIVTNWTLSPVFRFTRYYHDLRQNLL